MTRISESALAGAGAVWIACCITFGGASAAGTTANLVLQLGAIAFLLLAIWWIPPAEPVRGNNLPSILLGLLAAYLTISAIPLPPELWSKLPGRAPIAAGYKMLGIALPWQPIALDTERLMRSASWLLVPLATYVLFRRMEDRSRGLAIWIVIAAALFSVVLGAMQLAGGPDSPLRWYAVTNRNAPVGYFANANHLATLLLIAIPFAAVALRKRVGDGDRTRRLTATLSFAAIALVLTAGVVVDRSVAGLILLLPVLVASAQILISARSQQGRRVQFWMMIVVAVAVAIAAFSLFHNVEFASKWRDGPGSRGVATPVTLEAARDFMPFGSGLGTFTQIYSGYEPARFVTSSYMNHAHNDYAEVLLELGLPGLILMAAGLALFLYFSYVAWTDPRRTSGYGQAASIAIALTLAHSVVDYPLRTAAISAVIAMAWAMLLPRRRYGMTTYALRPDGAEE